jgi:hypothetical protein
MLIKTCPAISLFKYGNKGKRKTVFEYCLGLLSFVNDRFQNAFQPCPNDCWARTRLQGARIKGRYYRNLMLLVGHVAG